MLNNLYVMRVDAKHRWSFRGDDILLKKTKTYRFTEFSRRSYLLPNRRKNTFKLILVFNNDVQLLVK